MKKSTIIALIILQIAAITIFSSAGALLKSIKQNILKNITESQQQTLDTVFTSLGSMESFFSWFTITLGATILISAILLIKAFRKPQQSSSEAAIPPLQNYLLELKSSERSLMNSIKEHQAKSSDQDILNRNIISNIDKALIVTDIHSRIRLFNSAAEKIFNRSYSSTVNNPLSSILKDYPGIGDFINSAEGKRVTKDIENSGKFFRVGVIPLKNTGYLFLIEDITDEKNRAEIDKRNSTMISLGEMASFLAHEIRNSLGVIYGYTGTMSSEPEKLEKINREIRFMTSMMENFLSFSSPVVSGVRENVDLKSVLEDSAVKSGIKLVSETDIPSIESDINILNSIFSNLFLNASQAGAGKISVRHTTTEKSVDLYIKDDGCGIPEENFGKIWLPFFSTKPDGNGMGLAIVKKHLNAINSDIEVMKSSDKGTEFHLSLYSVN